MSIKTNYEDIRELERNLFILDERLAEAEDRLKDQEVSLIILDKYVDYLKTQYTRSYNGRKRKQNRP
jgi:hypothetical protein